VNFVGVPDLRGRPPGALRRVAAFPSMAPQSRFRGPTSARSLLPARRQETPVLFLCRSGGRSRAAAIAMGAAGYSNSFNVAGGFEGDLDAERHRAAAMAGRRLAFPGNKLKENSSCDEKRIGRDAGQNGRAMSARG